MLRKPPKLRIGSKAAKNVRMGGDEPQVRHEILRTESEGHRDVLVEWAKQTIFGYDLNL